MKFLDIPACAGMTDNASKRGRDGLFTRPGPTAAVHKASIQLSIQIESVWRVSCHSLPGHSSIRPGRCATSRLSLPKRFKAKLFGQTLNRPLNAMRMLYNDGGETCSRRPPARGRFAKKACRRVSSGARKLMVFLFFDYFSWRPLGSCR